MKKKLVAVTGLILTLQLFPMAQFAAYAEKPLPPSTSVSGGQKAIPKASFQMEDGTTVRLKFVNELSSKTAEQDQPIEFRVVDDVYLKGKLVIAEGAMAKGYVREVKRSGMLGRKGKLDVALRQIELADGSRIKIRAAKSQGGQVSGGVIAVAAIINPLFLLIKGKNVIYTQGAEFDAFVDGDFELDPSSFKAGVSKKPAQ
jgi:hypothetical protein